MLVVLQMKWGRYHWHWFWFRSSLVGDWGGRRRGPSYFLTVHCIADLAYLALLPNPNMLVTEFGKKKIKTIVFLPVCHFQPVCNAFANHLSVNWLSIIELGGWWQILQQPDIMPEEWHSILTMFYVVVNIKCEFINVVGVTRVMSFTSFPAFPAVAHFGLHISWS